MSLATFLGKVVDNTVSIISPKAALQRKFYRSRLSKIRKRSRYAAAKTDRLTGPWAPTDPNVNELISASSTAVRARVRQLVRDFPFFTRAVNVMIDHVVGSGIQYQAKVENQKGNLNKTQNQKLEDSFKFWAEKADISGKLHYYELMDLAKRQDLECGEFILIKRLSTDKSRYLPFALQMIEADWLTSDRTAPANEQENIIDQGIEYKKATGEIIRYHFTDPDGWGKTISVDAESVVHGMQTLRPGQLRGISPFAPGVLLSHDLHDYLETEIDAAKMASKYLAFVKSPSMEARQTNLTDGTDDDEGKKIDEMENAIIEYLSPGEEIEISTNPRPGTNFPPFVRLMLLMVSATINVPYEFLSMDYKGMNYSTARTVRNDFSHFLRPIVARHVRQFAFPTFYPFLENAVLNNKLALPGFFANPVRYLKSEWQGPGMESVDPLRETKAMIDQVKNALRSPQEIAKARGRDIQDIIKEIAQFYEMLKDAGIEIQKTSDANANNPAALGASEGENQKAMLLDLFEKLEVLGS